MTTNNHPANGPVSLDRLHQIREILSKAAAQSDGGNLGYAMADAVKVIDGAIAAFGAEPAPVDIEMLATVLRNAPLAPSDSQGKPRAPVAPENCVTAEHRRVIEMLLNVCGAAFELADDSCQQDVDGEECHVVPDDAFQKLSDALDEIENTLPTEDVDRPDVFLAWSAMPRAALKSILQAGNSPVTPDGYVLVPIVPTEDMIINGFESVPNPHFSDEKEWEEYEALSGCRQAARRAELCWAAMIKAAPKQENI
ncbi:hypothetical protein QWS64_002883 [Escherichia coli]|uniref:hypothetical protein n=1 Tax=Enterobacteriaceae TaxID=543 RepID=UPI000627E851|nr:MULTISPECIES: hypothetical protein [Enterobacteriaceae]ELP1261531.1 hypothetical protein [Escherichia coli]KKJ90731.1 hypothetical protein TR64_03790 [Citrobacter freundii]MCG9437106.1 hypothetical protein [Escherichia coli]